MSNTLIPRSKIRTMIIEEAEKSGSKIRRVTPETIDDILSVAHAAVNKRIRATVEQNRQHLTCKPCINTSGMFQRRRLG